MFVSVVWQAATVDYRSVGGRPMEGRTVTRLGTDVCLLALLTSCGLPREGGGELTIVNQTDQPLFKGNARLDPRGGIFRQGVNDCGQPGMYLRDNSQDVFVRLTEAYCAGQTWTIYGRDKYTLEP
jgi:hypothetical protein